MLINIDCRESSLIEAIRLLLTSEDKQKYFHDINVSVEQLPLGDIIINNGIEDVIIIERKSLSDLFASIKDNRYAEQSFRLNACDIPNHNIVYLIEGSISKLTDPDQINLAYSTIFSLNHYKGFSTYKSNGINESAYIICNMCYKMRVNMLSNKKPMHEKTYGSVVASKSVKCENITEDNIDALMLSQIPGVSYSTSNYLVQTYGNIKCIINLLESNVSVISECKIPNTNGKLQKIRKNVVDNLVKYLVKGRD